MHIHVLLSNRDWVECTSLLRHIHTWFVKELDMTKLGCPMAQPRLTRRPSARRIKCRPFFIVYRSTCGLMLSLLAQLSFSHLTSNSQSKCPMLQTMVSSNMFEKCSPFRMSLQPVVVTYRRASVRVSSIVDTS